MSSVSGGEFKARRRREKKMKKEKWMEMKKKMKMMEAEMYERVLKSQDFGASRPVTKALTMEKAAASGTNEKLRFYNPNTPLPRPQDVYHIKVDNTNKPFKHVLLEKSPDIVADNTSEPFKHALLEKSPDIVVDNTNESFEQALLEKSPDDDARPTHPLEKLPVEQLFDRRVPENLPLKPPELSDTTFTFVENRKALNKLASKLKDATEFAVNIEDNHNRSFQGLTCLMQISTRTEDFIVDTLKLRKYLGEKLREVFQDPTKKKVMHGAGPDITWLQRDFGIYICNLFDIAQASRILRIGYNCKSVTHLLHQFCGVRQRKRYRSADWRRRPLPSGMIEYAREVTHYLLYIYDLMRLKLVNESSGEDDLLLEVCKCSNRICLQLYEKELLTDSSYLYTHGLKANELSARQLSVLAGLYQWRDSVARAEDESTAYILPDKTLLEIAKQTPVTARRLKRTVVSKNKFLEHHLGHVISIVRNAVANSDAFENIAQQLKNERLEELMVEDAKSSSEDTEMITAVDADNNGSNSHLSDEPAVVPGFSNKQGHVSRGPFFTFIVDGSLDYFAICGTLNKVLKWKGFDQLTILIKYSIIPFIKRCPEELWPKLVDEVLYPVFNYFRVKLSNSWRKLLRDGSVQVPDRTPSLSKEDAYKYGSSLIIQLTRAASELLAVIASPVLNGSSGLACSRSLAGYILCRDVPMLPMLSLIHHIFGEWNDDEAKMTLVPFCYEVIHVASAEHLDDAVSFIEDGVIPHLIQCLAFKTLKSTQLDVLRELCRKAFHCVQNSNQGLMSAEKHNESIVFESWLREEISHTNAPSHELGQLVWIWEMEEEFMEYIAAYIDMLQEVNEMEDCLDYDYSSPWDLFDELKPDFKSKYGIDSASHDYVWTMSAMLSRKASAMHWERRNAEMFRFFCELIDFKPYIQHSSYDDSVMELVRNSERYPGLAEFLRVSALEEFREMLMLWEPQFHPMIRKGHKHVLREILDHSTYMENITYLQPLQPDIGDFPVHLVPYATNYIGSMNKMYHMAKEQANLHEKFDAHLASGALDQYICKDDALKVVRDDDLLPTQFSVLDHDLIKLSFERRAKFLDMQCQLHSFYKGVQDAINDEQLRIVLQSLIVKLKDQGFFDIADDATDSDNECFSELVDEFKKQVFARLRLPDYYVIRGIMDYRAMSLEIEGSSCSWPDAFEAVVGEAYRRWIRSSHLFWMDTRCYKHQYYDFIRQPFEKGLYQWRDSVARAEDESTAYILPDKTLLEIAKQTPVTARRLKRTVVSKNKFLEHHLGHVISIVRNAVANSDAFENIAQQLKNERLEELTVEDAKSSSEDTEMITAVDADNNGSNSHLSDEPAVVPGFSNKQGHVSRGPFFTFIVDGSLDYFAICGTLNKVLKWKGFDQLTILIKYSIIPFIKRCPEELWPKLVDEVLYPVFNYFRVKLSNSWRKLLRDGSVQVPDRTPSLSKEDAYKYGSSLIIQLTRAASELLAVIASPVLNESSGLACSRSLAGYILCRDVPMLPMLSLIHHIFGEWNDDEAKMTLVPFCYEVIHVASAEHLDDAVSFIEDGVIPHLIQCLAFKTLKSTQLDVLRELCRKAFHCVQNSNQGLMSAEKHNESIVFESWLREEISHTNAPSHELGQLVWIWEMEEEFMEYIAAYIDMLQEVNEMEDCLDYDYSSPWDLFDELKPDFKSKYGIDSASHDYVWTMSAMLSRKASAMHWERRNAEMFRFFCELIDFKPYIQHSSYDDSVMELVRNSERYPGLAEFLRVSALEEFREMLMLWEPQFHPMIRKGHKHVLREILDHSTYMENITYLQPLQPDIGDFPVHLVPYATNYIGSMNKMYHMAKEQANLHEKFDAHLASGALDQYICKDDALKVVRDDDLLPTQFSVLDHDLIKLSFERRAKFLDMQCQLHSFYKGVQDAINDEQLRIVLQSLIVKLKDQGFFDIADDATDSDNECFSELVDEFKKQVFARLRLPDYYVIRGIMDYRAMSLEIEGSSCSWPDAFEAVVGEAYRRWIRSSHLFWMDTRCYKHQYYDFIRQPFEKIWKKDPKKKDSEEGIKDPTVEYAVPLS